MKAGRVKQIGGSDCKVESLYIIVNLIPQPTEYCGCGRSLVAAGVYILHVTIPNHLRLPRGDWIMRRHHKIRQRHGATGMGLTKWIVIGRGGVESKSRVSRG